MKKTVVTIAGYLCVCCAVLTSYAGYWEISTTTTIPNPVPEIEDYFGEKAKAVGNGRFLVTSYADDEGASGAGSVAYYDADFSLIQIITNPAPTSSGVFGFGLSDLDDSSFVISAYNNDGSKGAVYIYSTNGTLLTTITNPSASSSSEFGYAVEKLDEERILVGARKQNGAENRQGRAYLFHRDGTLLQTFENPHPAQNDYFGSKIVTVSSNLIVIAAEYDNTFGAVYLYDTNATLLTTITNPAPTWPDYFGQEVSCMSTNALLIAAPQDGGGSYPWNGEAYLYAMDGTLLHTYTNPLPIDYNYYGYALEHFLDEFFFLGAPGANTGQGLVYFMNTNGEILLTIESPDVSGYDYFGLSLSMITSNKLLVGAEQEDLGAADSGAAYVFEINYITNNRVPITYDTNIIVRVDQATTGWVTAIDLDEDPLVFSKASDPAHAEVTVETNGLFQYSSTNGYYGSDAFTFSVSDGNGGETTGTVYITVNAQPQPDNKIVFIDEDEVYNGTLSAVDPDQHSCRFELLNAPSNGWAEVYTSGSCTYTPAVNFSGNDSFTFLVTDSLNGLGTGTVSVTVRDWAPVVSFYENFGSGVFSNYWSVYTNGEGRVQLTQAYGPEGSWHVTMDDRESNLDESLNELVLTLDLSSADNMVLSFWHKSFYDEDHSMPDIFTNHYNADGVAISVDGGTIWYKAQSLVSTAGTSADYKLFSVDLNALLQTYTLNYVSNFMVKFQQYDDSPIQEDGFAFDEISIFKNDPMVADIAVDCSVSESSITVSNLIVYSLTVWNNGLNRAENIAVLDSLPTGASFVSASEGGHYDAGLHCVHFSPGSLEKNETNTLAVVVEMTVSEDITNAVTIYANTVDPVATNNSDTCLVHVDPVLSVIADIQLSVSDAPDPVALSNSLHYTITLFNAGVETATNVICSAEFPPQMTFVSFDSTGALYDGLFIWVVDQLESGSNVVYTLTVSPEERGWLSTDFQVVSASVDTNLADNSISVDTYVTMDVSWERVRSGVVDNRYISAYSGGTDFARPTLGDLDADGDLDMLYACYYSASIPYYRIAMIENVGNPEFAVWVSDPEDDIYLTTDYGASPHLADFDNDGDLDLFYGDYSGVHYRENTGTVYEAKWAGQYSFPSSISSYGSYNSVEMCDIDGDNDPDLFVKNRKGLLYVENTGSGWSLITNAYNGITNGFIVSGFYDIDHDADYDMLLGTSLYENTGTVSSAAWALPVSNENAVTYSFIPNGDLDNDGDSDLVMGNSYGSVMMYENIGTVSNVIWGNSITHYIALDFGEWTKPALVDLDADYDYDLFVGSEAGTCFFIENKGDARYPRWGAIQTNALYIDTRSSPTFTDIDGDGDQDLFVGDHLGSVTWFENTGTVQVAAWAPAQQNYADAAVAENSIPKFCDIDDDGDEDLFLKASGSWTAGAIHFYENTGTVSEAQWIKRTESFADATNTYCYDYSFVDLDKDQDFDLVLTIVKQVFVLYENTGTVSSAAWAPGVTNFGGVYAGTIAGTDFADVDADGDIDCIFGDSYGGLQLWLNKSRTIDVTPAKKTLRVGENIAYSADTDSDEVCWRFVLNNSSGTINSNTGYYTAGAQPGLDIIEVTTLDGGYGRAFVNVIEETEASGDKVIIISGRNTPNAYDPVWLATDNMADCAYETFLYKGYTKSSIQYLSPVTEKDVDGNGVIDDVDATNTYSNVSDTFQYFATNAVSNLFVYLVDHGETNSGGRMRLSPSETLAATQLSQFLDDLQNAYQMDVTVVLDFCYAGEFLDDLVYTGAAKRVVIASTTDVDPAFFIAQGLVSFSEAFFNALLLGFDVQTAFLMAQQAISDYQDAWLDDDKDGIYDPDSDGDNSDFTIGGSTVSGSDIPEIGLIAGNQSLDVTTEATLWASDISATYPIDRVWCVVIPPGYNPDPSKPIVDLPEIDLYDVSYRYESIYQGFSEPGTYKLIYYAMDVLGNISVPKYGYVSQGGYDERVILVAGGATNEAYSDTINEMAENAYQTFIIRQIAATNICYLSNHAGAYVDDSVSSNTIADAITNWADGSDKLILYMIGNASNLIAGSVTNVGFEMNAGDYLDAQTVDSWLDSYQAETSSCIVVMDSPGSGDWIDDLTVPMGAERIVLSSADQEESCIWLEAGAWNSFSRIFLSYIYRGVNLDAAFSKSRTYTFNLSHSSQNPQMDDDGNGVPNEKSEGAVAAYRYIGSSFVTADGALAIGSVTPDTLLLTTNTLMLWAADVVSELDLSNVWATITQPDYVGDTMLDSIDLSWNETSQRYEASYTNFSLPGVYYCTFFAMDVNGTVSCPLQTEVLKADAYESDNTYDTASEFPVREYQRHNFHQAGDEDWAQFFISSNHVYELRTVQLGTNVDTVLEIYYEEQPGVAPVKVYARDDESKGRGDGEYALLDHWDSGWYWARVYPYDADSVGNGSEYDLQIYMPEASDVLIVVVADMMNLEQSPPSTEFIVDDNGTYPFGSLNNSISISSIPEGTWTTRVVTASGYMPRESPVSSGQVSNPKNKKYGHPKEVKIKANGHGYVIFVFEPYITVNGLVRNQWSDERLEGAYIEFEPLNGYPANSGYAYNGYPAQAHYKTRWETDRDGVFPTNVILPPVDWTMHIHLDGYITSSWEFAISGVSAGIITNVGTCYLLPIDSQNTNGLADRWENITFGGPVSFTPEEDSDGDGVNNWDEYLSGTDPNNGNDALMFGNNGQEVTGSGYTLRWPSVPGHCYRILVTDSLVTDSWSLAAGPWTNDALTEMEWTDTNVSVNVQRCYRVEEMRP